MGGTFDPVHRGHIAMALAIHERLSCQQMLLIPCGEHALGKRPQATAQQRFDMLSIVTEDYPQLIIDDRELTREGISYTVDSCHELRVEHGSEAQICFVVGSDVLCSLHQWHNWQQLLDLVNIIVVKRAEDQLASMTTNSKVDISNTAFKSDKLNAEVMALLQKSVECIDAPHGQLMLLELPPYPYASNTIRAALQKIIQKSGQCFDKFENTEKFEALDEKVLRYIVKHGIYSES